MLIKTLRLLTLISKFGIRSPSIGNQIRKPRQISFDIEQEKLFERNIQKNWHHEFRAFVNNIEFHFWFFCC